MKAIVRDETMDQAWRDWKIERTKGIKDIKEFTRYLIEQYGIDITETFLKDHNTWEIEIVDEKLAALFLMRYS